ncbi:MAG: hypothetical protein E7163_05060 [Firmicutes bacterium]|nr:hypothetical protein [Bacillota bacterium]
MKYYLAVDKGNFRNLDDRYKILDLSQINPELGNDDNLKLLVKFTTTFETKKTLKDLLIAKGVLAANNAYYDIVMYYEHSYPKTLDVAYKVDEEYLDIGRLSNIIYDKLKNKVFFDTFLNYYEQNSFLEDEIGLIREYAGDIYANHRYYEAIRRLINKICYKKNSAGKTVLNYRQLYDLGMFVSKLANKGRNIVINRVEKESIKANSIVPEEGTAERDKWDELYGKEIDDDQIKLF